MRRAALMTTAAIAALLAGCASMAANPKPRLGALVANAAPPQAVQQRDGQHDFDWDIGSWKVHMRRLLHPLSGSTTWVEYDGTDVVRKVWDGRANLGEVELDGAAGHLEFLTLRLYNPQSHQWSMNISSSTAGTLSAPAIGGFEGGRGEFYDQEAYNGRTILVRVVWADIPPDSHSFEQSFSDDGGKTWEPNFMATLTREKQ